MGESAIRPTPDTFEPIGEFGWEADVQFGNIASTSLPYLIDVKTALFRSRNQDLTGFR